MRLVSAVVVVSVLAGVPAGAQTPYLVKDVQPGPASGVEAALMVPVGDRVFFRGYTTEAGYELWSSAGTEASTTMLELTPGTAGQGPQPFTAAGGKALFFYYSGAPGLWSTDGTLAGTQSIADSLDLGAILVPGGDRALLEVAAGTGGNRALVSDGTQEGTYLVPPPPGLTEAVPAPVLPNKAARYGDGFAIAMDFLTGAYWTDGPPARTTQLLGPTRCFSAAAAGAKLFLACAPSPSELTGLWVSDGTYGGSTQVLPSVGYPLTAVGDRVFFPLAGGLGFSDGTSAGSGAVPMPAPAPTSIDLGRAAKASGDVLYFIASTPATGGELWRTDGTAAGTFLLRDIEPGPTAGVPASLTSMAAVPGGLIFTARTSAGGSELWKSDGTTAGTVPLPEIFPGADSSSPIGLGIANGRLFFSAFEPVHGSELWALDLPKGTVAVDDTVVEEGDAGTTQAALAVRLESASSVPVVVSYQTVGVTAEAGGDFTPASGVLTFAPGEREKTVTVSVLGDPDDEPNESLKLVLTPVGGSIVSDPSGVLVIQDDDQPRVRPASIAVVEGNSGTSDAVFGLTLETAAGVAPVTVGFTAVAGSATGNDFIPLQGSVTFPPGSPAGTTQTAAVPVIGDTLDEPNESFTLVLDDHGETEIVAPDPTGRILDDDGVGSARPVELAHGSNVRADLLPFDGPGPDRDVYVLLQRPEASYELVVDEASGDAAPLTVQRIAADGSTVLQSATAVGTGSALSLRWDNWMIQTVSDQQIRVESASCGTVCGADDTYRVRLYDTTLGGARVNNSNGQVTLLLVQNLTDEPVTVFFHIRTADGVNGGAGGFPVPPRGSYVHDLSQNLFVPGSVWVTHDAPYGGLVGKVVQLDPAAGFAFETPLVPRPR